MGLQARVPGRPFPSPTLTNTNVDLGRAMAFNPNLRVLVLNGQFDLATPFFASEYMMAHVSPQKDVKARIEMKYYEAGHMMYVNEGSAQGDEGRHGGLRRADVEVALASPARRSSPRWR